MGIRILVVGDYLARSITETSLAMGTKHMVATLTPLYSYPALGARLGALHDGFGRGLVLGQTAMVFLHQNVALGTSHSLTLQTTPTSI